MKLKPVDVRVIWLLHPFLLKMCFLCQVVFLRVCFFVSLHYSEAEADNQHAAAKPNNEPDPSFLSVRPSEMQLTLSLSALAPVVQCLEMTTKRKLIGRLVPCRCFRGEEEVISVLDYSHCSLQQVPKEIFSFERTLEELYLDANQIEELPKVTEISARMCLSADFMAPF